MMPPPKTRRFRSIMCAVDFSPYSAKALRYAAALARSCGGTVTAMFAVDPLLSAAAATAYDSHVLERGAMKDLTRFVRGSLGASSDLLHIGCVVAIGKAGAVVVEQAHHLHADVVVLGTNARHGAGKLFFGSTTEAVLRRFRGPVLVVPPHARQPRRAWPCGSIVAAVSDAVYRRAEIAAAARMAEAFGAWLSIVPVAPVAAGSAAARAEMIIYALPRANRLRMFRQGSAAYQFICGARAPVLVIRTGRTPGVRLPAPRRAA